MINDTAKYDEPWRVVKKYTEQGDFAFYNIETENDVIIEDAGKGERDAADRIVACVNAAAGINDPIVIDKFVCATLTRVCELLQMRIKFRSQIPVEVLVAISKLEVDSINSYIKKEFE